MWIDIFITIIVLLVALADIFLAIYVLKQNPNTRINKNFFYFALAIFLWCIANFILLLIRDLFWLRIVYSMGTLVPLAGIPFAYTLANKKMHNNLKIFIYGTSVILFLINISTPLLIKNLISISDFGIKADFGIFFYIWGIHLTLLSLIALITPLTILKKADEQRKKQILYFTTGAIIFAIWTISVNVILPFLGFTKFINIDAPATIFLVGFTSYSIIKYHLMDIKSLFFYAFVYSSVIVTIIAFLLLLMSAGSFLFTQSTPWLIYIMAFLISIILFFIGRLFFVEKRELEKAKINLTNLLKKSEEHLLTSELERDKTKIIINNFTDGLIIINEKYNISSINPEATKILQLNPGKIIDKPFQSMAYFSRSIPILKVLNEGFLNISRKEIEISKDFIIELSVVKLNLNRNDIEYLVILHDISREKIIEKMKTEFVSLAAHQLRTPLSIIKWSISMLKNGHFGKLNKKQSEIVINTYNNNERLILLVNDLLNVTHLEEGVYLYKKTMTNIRDVVISLIDDYKDIVLKRKIIIDFNEKGVFKEILLDSVKIKLAIQNLFDNAIKYSQENSKIEISLVSNENTIEFKIKDFGIGIPKDQQGKIFTKFFRGDNATKLREIGSGLGLFLCKNIIEAHGGKIWFESKENTETSFYFSLPINNKI
jgi:signal transduction histidine kinase